MHDTLPPTDLCRLLGCRLPLLLAGMGGVARSELVAAVTGAGAFGFLGMVREPLALIEREVAQVRARTDLPFGVNLIPAATPAPLLREQVGLCITLRVPVVCLFWDVDRAVAERLRGAGITVVHQVGSVQDALDAAKPEVLMIMQVHDELVFELPEGDVDWLRAEVPRLMAGVAQLKVPLLAEVGVGNNWEEAH